MTISVPIFFHVITSGTAGNLTDTQLPGAGHPDEQGLQRLLRRREHGLPFELAGVTRTDNADWFYGGIGARASDR